MVRPPVGLIVAPVKYCDASEAKKATNWPISSGLATPSGLESTAFWYCLRRRSETTPNPDEKMAALRGETRLYRIYL